MRKIVRLMRIEAKRAAMAARASVPVESVEEPQPVEKPVKVKTGKGKAKT